MVASAFGVLLVSLNLDFAGPGIEYPAAARAVT